MTGPVLLVRPDANAADAAALAAAGLPSVVDPYLRTAPPADSAPARDLLVHLGDPEPGRARWLVLTSPRSLSAWAGLVGREALYAALRSARRDGLLLAAVGPATAAALPDGMTADVVAQPATAARLVGLLVDRMPRPSDPPPVALVPQSAIARPTLTEGLRSAGWSVRTAAVYTTEPVPSRPASARAVDSGEVSAVVLRSPSAVAAVAAYARPAERVWMATVGPTTTAAARALPWRLAPIDDPHPDRVARALADRLVPGDPT